jgi:hypothetical protein
MENVCVEDSLILNQGIIITTLPLVPLDVLVM